MNFNASEEQRLLAASIERFIARDYGFDARRRIVASSDGYSRAIWKTLAELGWLGLAVPAELGGLGGGAADLAAVMDAIGSALIVEPFLATALATRIICKAGSSAQKNDLLPAVAAGDLVLAFAHSEERARYNLGDVTTRATKAADGFAIHGEKRVVLHAPCAQMFVVSARLDAMTPTQTALHCFWCKATRRICLSRDIEHWTNCRRPTSRSTVSWSPPTRRSAVLRPRRG